MKNRNLRPAFHALLALAATPVLAAPLDLRVVDVQGRGVAGTVVTLRSRDPSRPIAPPQRATLDQIDLQFVPHVLVVPAGSKVDIPNSDKVRHQVYSFSAIKPFELKLYSGKPRDPVQFDRPGVATLGCNIHDQMRAYVYVVEAQHFGRTDAQGSWKLPDVQPGEYTVQVWHPLSRDSQPLVDQPVTVTASGTPVVLRLATPLRLRPASQVPANWDAY